MNTNITNRATYALLWDVLADVAETWDDRAWVRAAYRYRTPKDNLNKEGQTKVERANGRLSAHAVTLGHFGVTTGWGDISQVAKRVVRLTDAVTGHGTEFYNRYRVAAFEVLNEETTGDFSLWFAEVLEYVEAERDAVSAAILKVRLRPPIVLEQR